LITRRGQPYAALIPPVDLYDDGDADSTQATAARCPTQLFPEPAHLS